MTPEQRERIREINEHYRAEMLRTAWEHHEMQNQRLCERQCFDGIVFLIVMIPIAILCVASFWWF